MGCGVDDDDLRPIRGVLFGTLFALLIWFLAGLGVALLLFR